MSVQRPLNPRQCAALVTASRAGVSLQVRWNEAASTGTIRVGRVQLTRPRSKARLAEDLERIQNTLKREGLPAIKVEVTQI